MSQVTFQPTWALIKKPGGYPEHPQTGKPEMIWRTNYHSLYHRLSPYSDYDQSLIRGFTTQPYLYTYPDDGKKTLMKYDSRMFPIGSAPRDVVRVAKFLGSGKGIMFLGKQFLLQTGNPYNETRIYNPTSPIVAAGMGLALGSIRPQRFIDTSGGLLGVASSLLGPAASLFGEPKVNPPSGTAGLNALSDRMKAGGGKGLIRAGTAERAKSHLDAAWDVKKNKQGFVKGLVKSLFQNFIPQTQPNIQYRSDEGAYGLMLAGAGNRFNYTGASGTAYGFGQLWIGGMSGLKYIRKKAEKTPGPYRIFVKYDGGVPKNYAEPSNTGFVGKIPGIGAGGNDGVVGYAVAESGVENNPGYRYGERMGKSIDYEGSDVMYQYKYYADPKQKFPTKRSDAEIVKQTNLAMQIALNKIRTGGTYTVTVPQNSPIFTDNRSDTPAGYDRLFNTKNKTDERSGHNYKLGVLKAYRDSGVTLVDSSIATSTDTSYKLPTNGTFDAINTLRVLDGDRAIKESKLIGWVKWEPYKDDLIALYFYDVVNDKYIPFRCAIKGLSESGNASWEEMSFIGRADKVYSYGGFTRSMNFNLKIVISSLVELIPTWQRINYITTLVKPANYTTATYANVTDRFMVPPMFMLTIGDMYKDQPILIQSVNVTIPDDAAWETANSDGDWSYLANMIKSPKVLFGQLPREIEIGFTIALLEKERAVVGGANFGHAPRKDNWVKWNTDTVPNRSGPNKMHQEFVVDVIKSRGGTGINNLLDAPRGFGLQNANMS